MPLRWGIVGLGRLAHEAIAPAIRAASNGQLVAVASRDAARAQLVGAAHGVDRVYASYEEMMRDPGVEAVYIANQNNLHHPAVLAAAAAGKHILCEKPFAMNVAEAEEMVAACRKAGVTLSVGFQNRFSAVLQAAAAVVKEGRLGTLREITTQRYGPGRAERQPWRRELATAGTGALADMGVHCIDFVQWIVGDRIARVFAFANPPRTRGLPDETICFMMEFAGGCQATLRISREMSIAANTLEAFGTAGMMATGSLRFADPVPLTVRTAGGSEERQFPVGNLYVAEIEAFAREVAGERTRLATGEEAVETVRVTDAIIRSLETGISAGV